MLGTQMCGWMGVCGWTWCRCGVVDEVGVGSDEEHSLMDSPGVVCSVLGRWVCGSV